MVSILFFFFFLTWLVFNTVGTQNVSFFHLWYASSLKDKLYGLSFLFCLYEPLINFTIFLLVTFIGWTDQSQNQRMKKCHEDQ